MKSKIVRLFVLLVFLLSVVPISSVEASGSVYGFLDTFPKEEVTGYITASKMPVTLYPMTRDYFYLYWQNQYKGTPSKVRTYEISDVELGYKDLFMAPDPENAGGFVRYTILYHTQGSQLLAIGIYDRGVINKLGKYTPITKYYKSDTRTTWWNPDTEHTVIGDYYPSKIVNDLEVAEAILDYQAENGPFIAGQEYSMLDIVDFVGRSDYVKGKTSAGSLVNGGGACVMSTNMMKILSLMDADVTQHWKHPTNQKYFENPFGGPKLGIDATDATIESPSFDLRWIQPKTGYIAITATVMPDGDYVESEYGDDASKFDATEVITFRFTTKKPDLSSEKIDTLQKSYLAYRKGTPSTTAIDVSGSKMISQVSWVRNDQNTLLLQQIAPEERVSRFAEEISTDPLLKSLAVFRVEANAIDRNSSVRVGEYLTRTQWYQDQIAYFNGDKIAISKFESVLRHLDRSSNLRIGQKIQCYGLVVLVGGLDKRFPNIGGAVKDGVPIETASELIPSSVKDGSRWSVSLGTYKAMEIKKISEVNVGDLFVRYDTVTGHVAAVVGKKTIGGKTILLIASANQTADGIVALFEVDENNFEVTFGVPSYRKIILRNN